MGNLDSPYAQVTAFYSYWLGFSTVMDFCWVDEYDAMAGPNRKSRRLMEEENNKVRRKARREYNDTVRRLGDFVKKRDKRVIDMRVKRSEEMERKKEEERERKRRLERERKERVMAYEEPEWARVEDEEVVEWDEEEEEKRNEKEFYCKPKASVAPSMQIENEGDDEEEDENGVLEAMVAGIKNRKPHASTGKPKASVVPSPQIENEDDEVGSMEYNNRKSARKRRGAKKEKGRKNWEESQGAAASGDGENINTNGNENSYEEEPCSQHFVENEDNGKENEQVSSKNADNICEACGEEFDSRNKLHKHLGESGHATLKGR
uniref:DnaJ isogeny subfamily C member 21 n=1 Tax=Cajanus cajan TaxID=3821 RepID=A0A151SPN0_CAJCA|nr:DnaJ isogeny subfamily C member 21 [Cajanus cajan]